MKNEKPAVSDFSFFLLIGILLKGMLHIYKTKPFRYNIIPYTL